MKRTKLFYNLLLAAQGAAGVGALIFLFLHRELFYGESTETDQYAMKIEPMRPWFFIGACVIIAFVTLIGILHLLRLRKNAEESEGKAAGKTAPEITAVISVVMIGVNAAMSFFVIELINNPWISLLQNQYIILGCGITLAIYLMFVFLTNSVTLGMIAGNILFLVWGMANCFILEFRSIPLQWVDFSSFKTAMNVAHGYVYQLSWQMVTGICAVFSIIILYLHLGNYHIGKKLWSKIASRIIFIGITAAFYIVIFRTDFLADTGIWLRDWHPQYTYKLFGMESGFFAFAKASFPEPPEGYSEDRVGEIIETSRKTDGKYEISDAIIPDNIICVMNETYADMTIYPGLRMSSNPCEYFDTITENAQTGPLMVSVLGGFTANTEYEFLTGNSTMMQPSNVVYNSYIKSDQYSLARTLSAQGYRTIAMHPYYPNGWNREFVYPRMGFDEFISLDDFVNPKLMRGLVTDQCDYEMITDLVEQKEEGEKLFIFNVTIQNHSQYKTIGFPSTVEVFGYEGDYKGQAEQYETLISISNDALKYLIDYFSECDEKTLICFWGDHQPSVSDDYMTYLLGKDQETATFEEQQMQYQTKYLIWANYDIPEMQGQMLSSNYLGSYLLSLTGLDQPDYSQYLLKMRNVIPALNAYGYYGTDGVQHQYDTDDVAPAQQEKLDEYKCLIYNELTQEKNRDETFYALE